VIVELRLGDCREPSRVRLYKVRDEIDLYKNLSLNYRRLLAASAENN
jgi:hypothetical protein